MQGDKEHQTNRRRKTFRYRNHILTAAADRIAKFEGIPCYFSWWLDDSAHNCQTPPIPETPCPACQLKTLEQPK
jgi:hypothetical protein